MLFAIVDLAVFTILFSELSTGKISDAKSLTSAPASPKHIKKRGRPPKQAKISENEVPLTSSKRGRPPKTSVDDKKDVAYLS